MKKVIKSRTVFRRRRRRGPYTCQTCGSLVNQTDTEQHAGYHATVDEGVPARRPNPANSNAQEIVIHIDEDGWAIW